MFKKILMLIAGVGGIAASDHFERDAIAAVLMGEARGEGADGMRAVAEVIRNRGGDPLMTILRKGQFSCLNHTTIEELISKMRWKLGWRNAVAIAWTLIQSPCHVGNHTHGATHYARSDNTPAWALRMKRVAKIGNHTFYK